MRRRASFAVLAGLLGMAVSAMPLSAQLARPRVASPDAPKILVAPFVRDNPDSALSLLIADGVRDRVRVQHLDKFNLISRQQLCTVLTESGFPCDVPLEPTHLRQVIRFMNAKYVIEGSMIRKPGDSVLIIARLAEATGTTPQAVTITQMSPAGTLNSRTGADLANRLVAGYASFDEVAECRRQVEAGNLPRADEQARRALRQSPNNAGAWLCMAQIREAQNAPDDSVIAALRSAYDRDTLATAVMRRLATKYEARHDTTALIDMLKRILVIDFRDNELMTSTARLLTQMGRGDEAVEILNRALSQNPASVELLGLKAVAMGAGRHWDSAYALLETVADIDTSKVDSLFILRITNYAREMADTTKWMRWLERSTQKFPAQLDPWYQIAIRKMTTGDSAGAEAAARGMLQNIPPGGDSAAATRGYFARGNYVLAIMEQGHGNLDSAVVHADRAAAQDTSIRPQLAVIYYRIGDRWRADTSKVGYLDSAIAYFTRAKEWGASNPRLLVPTNFLLGIVQFQKGAKIDAEAQAERSCEKARASRALMDQAEAGIIAGVATNRQLANDFLSNYIPAYKQRGDTMIRQYCR